MNVYYTTFSGHWPVGACAVVVAETPEGAAHLLSLRLTEMGLTQDITPAQMVLVEPKQAVHIVLDGEY